MSQFDLKNIPYQNSRLAIVTGANSGLGYETTLAFAKKGIKTVMACRNLEKAENAKRKILNEGPEAALDIIQIDLAKLESVRSFANEFIAKYDNLDLLVNNAGVMMPPYEKTDDGFELQMAANYFGHFLLTGLLIDFLIKTKGSRVISLSSIAHKNAKIDFQDLQSEIKYSKFKAYGQSKLACLLFAKELDRRLKNNANGNTISVAAHPGASNTELSRHLPKWFSLVLSPILLLVSHSPKNGSKPIILAALEENVEGGDYYGPTGFKEMKGEPGAAELKPQAEDKEVADRLWRVSESLTKITYLNRN